MRAIQWKRSVFEHHPRGSSVYAIFACIAAALMIGTPISADVKKPSMTVTSASRSFLPGLRGVRLFDGAGQDQQISEEMVVKILYRSLQEVTAASGKSVVFELGSFSTLYPGDFSRVRWAELVTQHGGRHITIERVETYDGGRPVGVSYEPNWTTVASEQSAELQRLVHNQTVNQLFSELASQDGNLDNVVAVTRYRVTVSFEGASRSYNAAVLWLDANHDGLVTLAVQDNITERVDEAVAEKLRVGPRAVFEKLFLTAPSASYSEVFKSITGTTATCNPHEKTYNFPLSASDTTGHSSGGHESKARFNYTCQCDTGCRSTCLPSVTDSRCNEIGTLMGGNGTHKPRTKTLVQGGAKLSPDYVGADCGAGWACYIQYCPANICSGFQIEGSGQPLNMGIGVTFNASSQAVWDGQLDFPFQCDGCGWGEGGDMVDDPYVPENQDPFGGGSGGGWRPGCYWSCVPEWLNGIYYEECTVIC